MQNTYIQARILSCKKNQKENSIFHQIKIDDNNNILVAASYYNENDKGLKWYESAGYNFNGIMSAITDDPQKFAYEFDTFRCPSSPGKPGESGPNLPDYGNDYQSGDYALINIKYSLSTTIYPQHYYKAPRITDCNDPANLVWMFDKGYRPTFPGQNCSTYFSKVNQVMHFPGLHNGGKTFSFMDGHVEAYDRDYLNFYLPLNSQPPSIPGTLFNKLYPAKFLYFIDLPRSP